MKPTYHDFLPKEKREKLVSVGKAFAKPVTYTKDDFLTPGKVAEKFGISTEKAKNIMKDLIFKRAAFSLNGHKAQIVVRMNKDHAMYLHPLATEAFQQHLAKQKD